MKLWFIGTGQFAALCLENLVTKHGLNFEKIITGLPTRSGRNNKENPSHVEIKANELGLNVTRTGKLNDNAELISELETNTPNIIFVIDFGQIIKPPFLDAMCLNIHPSLLPKYRGAAPIQRALLNGESVTGVSVFRLVKAMDAGGILAQEKFTIPENFNASDLYITLAEIGCRIAVEALKKFPDLTFIPQDDSLATYADKLSKCEFELSRSMTARKFCNTVRALDMSGAAYIVLDNKRVKIWRVCPTSRACLSSGNDKNPEIACCDSSVELLEVQCEGKKRTTGQEWARGLRVKDFM